MALAIDGELLCHIINLYRLYKSPGGIDTESYEFPFGKIILQNGTTRTYVFESAAEVDLRAPKLPFRYYFDDIRGLRDDLMDFGDLLETRYITVLSVGISDERARVNAAGESLETRASSLINAIGLFTERDWKKRFLISSQWIRDANKIKRRITTDGGNNDFHLDHILNGISNNPDMVKKLKAVVGEGWEWQDELRLVVRSKCMFTTDSFKFVWNRDERFLSTKICGIEAIVDDEIPNLVTDLTTLPQGSREKLLTENVTTDNILKVLQLEHNIVSAPVIVLYVPTRKEWSFVGEISG
jgi:hypothetical protein